MPQVQTCSHRSSEKSHDNVTDTIPPEVRIYANPRKEVSQEFFEDFPSKCSRQCVKNGWQNNNENGWYKGEGFFPGSGQVEVEKECANCRAKEKVGDHVEICSRAVAPSELNPDMGRKGEDKEY
jgi:methionyl-tRNA synthetase